MIRDPGFDDGPLQEDHRPEVALAEDLRERLRRDADVMLM
jgi:hypothetical protein